MSEVPWRGKSRRVPRAPARRSVCKIADAACEERGFGALSERALRLARAPSFAAA